jgi:archaellum component FlaC
MRWRQVSRRLTSMIEGSNYRLDDVENKLKETAQEFEQARKDSKDAKEKFNKIKQERFDLFLLY